MPDSAALTVRSTKDWEWTNSYNIQLSPDTRRNNFPTLSHGDPLRIEAEHNGTTFAIFGKADLRNVTHLDPGEIGIGSNLRYALGVPTGESIQVFDKTPPDHRTKRLDHVFGKRPVLCRVRKSVHPDIGFNVCRISETTMDALGITAGDRVVIESAEESTKLKALPLRDEVTGRKNQQIEQNPDRYPDPVDVLGIRGLAETDVDIPEIYLDAERRNELKLGQQSNADDSTPLDSGVCQPVKVTRNATSVYIRSLNESTVPVIAGLLATIFVFDPWLNSEGKVAIVVLGVLFILLSIWYRVRRQTFG